MFPGDLARVVFSSRWAEASTHRRSPVSSTRCATWSSTPSAKGVNKDSLIPVGMSQYPKSIQSIIISDSQVLSDVRKIVGDVEYVPTDPKQLCNVILFTCYMGTENSSIETKNRAVELARQIGAYHRNIVIDSAVSAVLGIFQQVTKLTPRFKVNGGSPRESLALQNIQVLWNHRIDEFPTARIALPALIKLLSKKIISRLVWEWS